MSRLQLKLVLSVIVAFSAVASAAPISPVVCRVIPAKFQQIISIDYDTVQHSRTAMALKAEVFPKTFSDIEAALKTVGVDSEKELQSLTFVFFRDEERKLKMIAVASGIFSSGSIIKKVEPRSEPMSYRDSNLYVLLKAADPKSKDLDMTFLDGSDILIGYGDALEFVLNVYHGDMPYLSDKYHAEALHDLEKAPVWSIMNREGILEF